MLNKNGFLHIKNILSEKIINNINEHIKKIDYNYTIYLDSINLSKYKKTNKVEITNRSPIPISIGVYLDGHNPFIKSYSRKVIQLWQFPYPKEKDISSYRGSSMGYLIHKDGINHIQKYYQDNQRFFYNIFNNTILKKYLKNLQVLSIKYFVNEPDCDEQEIHIDDDLHKDIIYLTIPLNYHEKFGATTIYNNNIVNKYKKNKSNNELHNMGNLNDFNTEQKNDFLKAEYKEPIQFGDILIFKGDTFHKGGKNLSNEARHFIHISFKKTLQLNLNITNMLYNY